MSGSNEKSNKLIVLTTYFQHFFSFDVICFSQNSAHMDIEMNKKSINKTSKMYLNSFMPQTSKLYFHKKYIVSLNLFEVFDATKFNQITIYQGDPYCIHCLNGPQWYEKCFFSDYLIGYLFDLTYLSEYVKLGKIIYKEAYFPFMIILFTRCTAVQLPQKIKIKLGCTFRK